MKVGSHVINEAAFMGLTESEALTMLSPFSEVVKKRIIKALKDGKCLKKDEPKIKKVKKDKEGGE
jgi:hypothetical protein